MFSSAALTVHQYLVADQHLLARGIGALGIALIAVIGIGYVVFFFAALLSVLGARVGCLGKLLWFVVILCLPFLGSLLWFVAGRPRD